MIKDLKKGNHVFYIQQNDSEKNKGKNKSHSQRKTVEIRVYKALVMPLYW